MALFQLLASCVFLRIYGRRPLCKPDSRAALSIEAKMQECLPWKRINPMTPASGQHHMNEESSFAALKEEAAALLTHFRPSSTELLDLLRRHITTRMLKEIAEADGGYKLDEHYQALRRIHDSGKVPVRLEWYPREVLDLALWGFPSPNDTRGHLKRAFCCAVLLRAGADPENEGYIFGENDTLAPLVESVCLLGRHYTEAALRFVCWRLLNSSLLNEERPFFALAVLLLCVQLQLGRKELAYLLRLIAWVEAEEACARDDPNLLPPESDQWLLGLYVYNQSHAIWRTLARTILLSPRQPYPMQVAEALAKMGSQLTD